MPYTNSDLGSSVTIFEKDESGYAAFARSYGVPPTTAGVWAVGALVVDTLNYDLYINEGTTASPSFNSVADIGAGDIGAGAVTLAKLASGISPSHVVKYAGTTGAYGGGGTSNAFTVTGATATDVASAVIRASTNAVSIVKAVLTTNTLTVHFSADPGAGTTVDYVIHRAAA